MYKINPADFGIDGLTDEEVLESRKRYGKNVLNYKGDRSFADALKRITTEPMVIILAVASSIYLFTGNTGDGIFLAAAIVFVGSISLYQDSRSRRALEQLKGLSQPRCRVIRNGKVVDLPSEDLVVGDRLMVEEGNHIPADGTIFHSNDFSVNESLLTGESLSVFKDSSSADNRIYRGTMVVSGLAVAEVSETGIDTRLGKIGKSLETIREESTPLERQIGNFVRNMSIWGGIAFLLVWGINFFQSFDVLQSLLKALTLAMSILPEEIPVAFTTFMALGAWRLLKTGIVVKQIKTVESLGSATVICVDKTGTITENQMKMVKLFTWDNKRISSAGEGPGDLENELITLGMWASEPIPFDPMEIALHKAYGEHTPRDERKAFSLIHEYPLDGRPPMMTHIFGSRSGRRIIAAKGAPEAFLDRSGLGEADKEYLSKTIRLLGTDGYRLLGVGEASWEGDNYPEKQQDFTFRFMGIIAFYDPPKQNIREVLKAFNQAGIDVKMVTGDNPVTAAAIARQVDFEGHDRCISGEELMKLSDEELKREVRGTQVFTRMFPDAKLRIVKALKSNNEVVAMIGDGVNDAPALKASHFGIAMGRKGTEIAKQAASLVLVDDDLSKLVEAIAMGRKIYLNLKKAIQYIISIHIPIILTVFIPLALGWIYPTPFSPSHVILLELIMGPTCSIIYENEPPEGNIMFHKPRPYTATFFNFRELATSILQGLVITLSALIIYQYAATSGFGEAVTRTMVFLVLMVANIFLTLVNRSFYYSIWTTLKYRNNLVGLIIGISFILLALLLYVPALTRFFEFEVLSVHQITVSFFAGMISVLWFEVFKWRKRIRYPEILSPAPIPEI